MNKGLKKFFVATASFSASLSLSAEAATLSTELSPVNLAPTAPLAENSETSFAIAFPSPLSLNSVSTISSAPLYNIAALSPIILDFENSPPVTVEEHQEKGYTISSPLNSGPAGGFVRVTNPDSTFSLAPQGGDHIVHLFSSISGGVFTLDKIELGSIFPFDVPGSGFDIEFKGYQTDGNIITFNYNNNTLASNHQTLTLNFQNVTLVTWENQASISVPMTFDNIVIIPGGTTIPEPSTTLLILAGGAPLLCARRRKDGQPAADSAANAVPLTEKTPTLTL